jgi:hypothetical protein
LLGLWFKLEDVKDKNGVAVATWNDLLKQHGLRPGQNQWFRLDVKVPANDDLGVPLRTSITPAPADSVPARCSK